MDLREFRVQRICSVQLEFEHFYSFMGLFESRIALEGYFDAVSISWFSNDLQNFIIPSVQKVAN